MGALENVVVLNRRQFLKTIAGAAAATAIAVAGAATAVDKKINKDQGPQITPSGE